MSQKKQIFISYGQGDVDAAKTIYRELAAAGLNPWMKDNDLLPGQNRKIEISRAIKSSDFFLMLLSSRSVTERGYVHKEMRLALNEFDEMPPGEIFLIPVRLDGCELPKDERIQDIEWIDYDGNPEKILQAIRHLGDPGNSDPVVRPERKAEENPAAVPPSSENGPQRNTPEADTPPPPENDQRQTDSGNPYPLLHQPNSEAPPSWALILSVASALTFLVILLTLVAFLPHPTRFQVFVFRVILALAAAAFGATIPGFLQVNLPVGKRGMIAAGGALALFVVIFAVNPPELITDADVPPPILEQSLSGVILDETGEPLSGVTVTLLEKDVQDTTDAQGRFSFIVKAEKSASVRLMAQKEGYKTRREDMLLGTSGNTFKMEPVK